MYIWPSSDMDFWKIENNDTKVVVEWSRNNFLDYKRLTYQFYSCGYKILEEVINDNLNNVKSDMWFLTGIFLIRHSLELGLKSLLCRVLPQKKDIQDTFKNFGHDVASLLKKYVEVGHENFLNNREKRWLSKYCDSLEEVDRKSDVFRFPFDDEFLSKYRDKFLDNIQVANNLLQAFYLVKKCLEMGDIAEEEEFNNTLKPEFFIFTSRSSENCYLWQSLLDEGFHVKIMGYTEVIDFIYQVDSISNEDKLYPLIFMFRNTIELCLKILFYSRVEKGVSKKAFKSKRKSHRIKKDLWKNVKDVIVNYLGVSDEELKTTELVEKMLFEINKLDKNGDIFRYPTSYSLEYRFDNRALDLSNIYVYLKAIVNFLEGCDTELDAIADVEQEIRNEYESETYFGIDWC
ncbi:hypothetical protein LMB63_10795 [Limosilactobacillus reuteri]|uniref:hypothetical protein n=2 Tax=Limosilactobacillus reuteri TaxID=1598 RepID=UPI00143CE751|nr:hypothetical protein [Limosilactobacillus reuteri]MBB1072300.1 hypothetical protein [Limosilactobacillus reuteri]MCC4511758.1 hypothetical protein [Limosilactobacillus reuteri]MCC4513408.1 hypothetical protein [Limosilactobacillus reuteri]QIZ04816.1 hypothetical protein GXL24_07720 [Limosilactobacillus reuteri]